MKATVVYNGFDFSGFAVPHAARKSENAVADAAWIHLAIIGSVLPAKGLEDGIRALAALLAEGLPVRLDIIGTGTRRHLDKLEALASELSVTDNVRLLGYSADVARELQDIAVTVVTSRFEVFGRIVVESLAQGTPVVATGTGGIPEIMSENRTGLFYSPGDHKELAAKVAALIRDREFYERLVANGWREVTQRFTKEKYVGGIRQAISEVMDEAAATSIDEK